LSDALTSTGQAHVVLRASSITDLAVFDFTPEGMVLVEAQEGVSVEEIIEKTDAEFKVATSAC
jgi:acyl CoA:acetate/3-ketoacid CoA transferase beta subunit